MTSETTTARAWRPGATHILDVTGAGDGLIHFAPGAPTGIDAALCGVPAPAERWAGTADVVLEKACWRCLLAWAREVAGARDALMIPDALPLVGATFAVPADRTELFHVLSDSGLDQLVATAYGKNDWSAVAEFEWHNGACYPATAEPAVSEDERADLHAFVAHGPGDPPVFVRLDTLLSGLAERHAIEPGRYLITVSW